MKNGFEQVTASELKNGFTYNSSTKLFTCLFCNTKYEDGYIYTFGTLLVDANKAIHLHIQEKHKSVFEALLNADKKQTGLTETQKEVLLYFYNEMSDKEIAKETATSPSTVRFQRYNFREKAKQAKIILALSELLEEKITEKNNSDKNNSDKNDDKTINDEVKMNTFFESVSPLVLKTLSVKNKNQMFILKVIAQQFESGKKYTEKQVNDILKSIYSDYATIRRELIDYGFMERTPDCKEYWLK